MTKWAAFIVHDTKAWGARDKPGHERGGGRRDGFGFIDNDPRTRMYTVLRRLDRRDVPPLSLRTMTLHQRLSSRAQTCAIHASEQLRLAEIVEQDGTHHKDRAVRNFIAGGGGTGRGAAASASTSSDVASARANGGP